MTTTSMDNTGPIENIGETLRLAREKKGITPSAAAMQTNLNLSVIEKLENNAFREIGAPVFSRGYLINYGRFLGLDANALTEAFNRTHQTATELHISSANAASQYRSFRSSRWKVWLKVIPLLAAAGVLAVQIFDQDSWLMTQFKAAFADQSGAGAVVSAEHAPSDIVIQIGEREPAAAVSSDTSAAAADLAEEPGLPELTSLESASADDAAAGETPENTAEDGPAVVLTAAGEADAADNTAPEQEAEPLQTAAPAPVPAKEIELSVSDKNWIEIRDKNRKIVQSKTFQKGDSVVLPLSGAPYELNIGRPGSAVLHIGGRTLSLEDYRVPGNRRLFRVGEAQ